MKSIRNEIIKNADLLATDTEGNKDNDLQKRIMTFLSSIAYKII
jgi:hypothetical protein